MGKFIKFKILGLLLSGSLLVACANSSNVYFDPNMDFGAVNTVAVMPFANLSGNKEGADRIRDVFITTLLSTGAVYAVPVGEVARGISIAGIQEPATPSSEEVIKLAGIVKADAIITGTVREYGLVRSGTTSSNVISLALQMIERETGRIVWTASSSRGGVSFKDRLLGGGGKPMNDVTEEVVSELIDKLFQ